MTQEQYTAGQRKFQHLTREKRAQIDVGLQQMCYKIRKPDPSKEKLLYNQQEISN